MKKSNPTISIVFTKQQFFTVMKAVFLGNWMANGYRVDDLRKDYEQVEDYIFSLAPKFGLDKFMDHEKFDGDRYYPARVFEENTDVHRMHEAYDEESMWDKLAEGLGERDFFEKYTEAVIKHMSRDERFTKRTECIVIYEIEFEKYGLRRIRIRKK